MVTSDAGKPKVSIKITGVSWPIYPDHTPKSKYINAQAMPLLQQETMQLQASAGTKLHEHLRRDAHDRLLARVAPGARSPRPRPPLDGP